MNNFRPPKPPSPKLPDVSLEKTVERELTPALPKKAPSISDLRKGDATVGFDLPNPPNANLEKTIQREFTSSIPKKAPSISDLRTEGTALGGNIPKSPGANLDKAIQQKLPPSLAKKAPSISDIRTGGATLGFNFKGEASAYVGQLLDPKNTPKAPAKLVGSLLRFQRKNGLRANGFVDAATLKALEEKAPKPGNAPMKGSEKAAQDATKVISKLKGAAAKENIAKVETLLEAFDPETLKSIIDALQKTKKAAKPPR